MTDELKPCKFCGGTASIGLYGFGQCDVECTNCHARTGRYSNKEDATYAWNREPPNEPLTFEELKDIVGQPVYIMTERIKGKPHEKWYVVNKAYDEYINFVGYGNIWDYEIKSGDARVYRHKPEEGEKHDSL